MYKRKKAVTLLETVIYLGLLSIVIGLFSISTKYFKNKDDEIKAQDEFLAIRDFIIDAKITCRVLNQPGVIYLNEKTGRIAFRSWNIKNNLELKSLKIKDDRPNEEVNISNTGAISKSYEFKVVDKKNKMYRMVLKPKKIVEIS